MITLSYRIGDPVETVPDFTVPRHRDGWADVYRAVNQQPGQWIPIEFQNRSDARRLAESARKLKSPMEAEVRGSTVYLKSER